MTNTTNTTQQEADEAHALTLLRPESNVPLPPPPPAWVLAMANNERVFNSEDVERSRLWIHQGQSVQQQNIQAAEFWRLQQRISGRPGSSNTQPAPLVVQQRPLPASLQPSQNSQQAGQARPHIAVQQRRAVQRPGSHRQRRNRHRRGSRPQFVAPVLPVGAQVGQHLRDLQEGIRAQLQETGATGTEAAYGPKEKEFYLFCEKVYGTPLLAEHGKSRIQDLPPAILHSLYTVSPEKAYAFIHFQGHRKK